MTELLSLIDASGNEQQVTAANYLRWVYPINGEGARSEEVLVEALARKYPHRKIGTASEPLILTLILYIMGNTRAELQSRLALLIWRTDPDRGRFIIKRTTSAGNVRQIDVTRSRYTADEQMMAEGGPRLRVEIECLADMPLWYDPVEGTASGTIPCNLSMANANAITPLHITLSGAATNARFTLSTGAFYEWEYALSSGVAYLEFDSEAALYGARLASSPSTDLSGYMADGSQALWAPPGTTLLACAADSGTPGVTVTFRKYYKVLA